MGGNSAIMSGDPCSQTSCGPNVSGDLCTCGPNNRFLLIKTGVKVSIDRSESGSGQAQGSAGVLRFIDSMTHIIFILEKMCANRRAAASETPIFNTTRRIVRRQVIFIYLRSRL